MKAIFALVCFTLLTVKGFGQDNYNAELIPSNLRKGANAVIRSEETNVDMRAPNNVIITVTKAVTILNKNGDENARLILFYDKNTAIKYIKGQVYNAVGKQLSKFNQNDFQDQSAADGFSLFVDSRVKHFLPVAQDYPYTVVYNYEIRNKQNLIIPDWDPQPADDISVEKSSYTFIGKATDELRIKAQNYDGKPEEMTDGKQKSLSWKVSGLVAIKSEPFSPDRNTYQTAVKIAAKDFKYYNQDGSYNNWKELGNWIYDDLLRTRKTLDPATVSLIKELVKNEKTDKDKARKIYQYMQDKTRYISVQIGIGGFQPVAAAEVDRLGYGDCKALVNYMQSLLDVAGIESLYCVVEAGDRKVSLDPSYASMGQGNHIILCMPLKGDTTWLECTSQKIPFGFLSTFTDDRLVLACSPEGGKLLKTPKLSAEANRRIRKGELTIDANGDAICDMETCYYGSQFDKSEEIIGKPFSEQQKLLTDVYDLDNINFSAINYEVKKDIHPEVIEKISLDVRNYALVNDSRIYIKTNPFSSQNSLTESRNRIFPVYINRGLTTEDTMVYNLPDNVATESLPAIASNYKSSFGTYVASTTLSGKKLTYYRKFVLNEGTFPAESYADFYKFITEVNSADGLRVFLSLKK